MDSDENKPVANGSASVHKENGEKTSSCGLSPYLIALRPWTFSPTIVTLLIGLALAYKSVLSINYITFLFSAVTVISVHAAGNVVNTYFDYTKGIDSKKSDDRTLVDRHLTPDDIVHLGALLYLIGCIGFVLVVVFSPAKMEHLALIYFGGLSGSFLYTGGIGLKYIALGDILVMVTFGPLTLFFAYTAQTGSMDLLTFFYALPLALNTVAIHHSNNTKNMKTDCEAGVVTLPILIGFAGSHVLYAFLLLVPYIGFIILALHMTKWFALPLITIPHAFKLEKHFREGYLQTLPRQTARLNLYFGLFYLLACILADRTLLPGIMVT